MGVGLAILLGLAFCALSLAIATVWEIPMLGLQDDVDGIPATLVATAGYSGAMFGFLQAVTIFAVQLRSQQDTSMLPLTPLIARRYFTFFILGSVAGVAIANLIGALAAPVLLMDRAALAALTWINLFAVPAATIAALWYLGRIIAEAGEADMDVALPVLRATMRAQALVDARLTSMLHEYARVLEAAGMQYSPFAAFATWGRTGGAIRIPVSKSGALQDVDCIQLLHAGKLLNELTPAPDSTITVALGQSIPSDGVLVLTWPSRPSQDPFVPALSDAFVRRIQAILSRSLIMGGRKEL